MAKTTATTGLTLLFPPYDANVISAFLNPEILICTFGYLFLKPILKKCAFEWLRRTHSMPLLSLRRTRNASAAQAVRYSMRCAVQPVR